MSVDPRVQLVTRIGPPRVVNWLGDCELADAEVRISSVRVRPSRPPTRSYVSPTLGDKKGVGVALDRGRRCDRANMHLPQNQRQPGIGWRLDPALELIAKH